MCISRQSEAYLNLFKQIHTIRFYSSSTLHYKRNYQPCTGNLALSKFGSLLDEPYNTFFYTDLHYFILFFKYCFSYVLVIVLAFANSLFRSGLKWCMLGLSGLRVISDTWLFWHNQVSLSQILLALIWVLASFLKYPFEIIYSLHFKVRIRKFSIYMDKSMCTLAESTWVEMSCCASVNQSIG